MGQYISLTKNGLSWKVVHSTNHWVWRDLANGEWEPETFELFDRFLTKEVSYIDIGAWIGPTVLYATQLAKETYAFEPDPSAYEELLANLNANPSLTNIKTYKALVGPTTGSVSMGNRKRVGDSTSSVLFSQSDTNWEAESIQLETFVAKEGLHSPLFVKIDIEGGEYTLLPALERFFEKYEPVVYLSVHPHVLNRALADRLGREGLTAKFRRRVQLFLAHKRVLESLRCFAFLYDSVGNRVNTKIWLLKVFIQGASLEERAILATNRQWGKADQDREKVAA